MDEPGVPQQEVFSNSENRDLAPAPDIDLGGVNVAPTINLELIDENEDGGGVTFNNTTERKAPGIDPDIGGNFDAASSTSKSSGGRAAPTECRNEAAAATFKGLENSPTNSNISSVLQGNYDLFNEMTTTRMDGDEPATTISSQHHTDGITVMESRQLQRPQYSKKDVSKTLKTSAEVIEKDVEKETGDEYEGLQQRKIQGKFKFKRKAKLDDAGKFANKKSRSLKRQEEKTNREVFNALFKAWHWRDQEGNFQLHLSAKRGDEESVNELIELGADVNAKNNSEETPLIFAASGDGNAMATVRILKSLIEQGADVFATDREGQTFLHKFALQKNPPSSFQFHDISSYLVSKNIASLFNIRDTGNGTTPFMIAARNVNLDMATISLLQTNGVNLNLVDNRGRSFLFYAAEGKVNSKILADPDGNGIIKHKNLAQAIEDRDEDSVYLLVNLGADVDEKNHYSETPLHLSAMSSNKAFSINSIKLLIDSGANVDARDQTGSIFLCKLFNYANSGAPSPSQFHELASFLISKDLARLFNASNGLFTPLRLAVQFVEIERATLSLLQNNDVDFNTVSYSGTPILEYAIQANRTFRLISDLVAIGGANPNPKHLSGHCNSMHFAAEKGRVDLLEFFVDHGLDVNARGSLGYTPLHYAIISKENAIKAVQFLLSKGANPDIVNDDGKSPRAIVNENRRIPGSVYSPYRICDAEQIATCFSLGSSR